MDRKYNVAFRALESFVSMRDSKEDEKFAHWDVEVGKNGEANAESLRSQYADLDPGTLNQVYFQKEGKTYMRVFCPKKDEAEVGMLTILFGPPKYEYEGTRWLSKATYLIYSTKESNLVPIYVKVPDGKDINNSFMAKSALQNNDFIESQLREDKEPGFSFFPERTISLVSSKGFEYANVFRSANPVGSTNESHPLPESLHVVLGGAVDDAALFHHAVTQHRRRIISDKGPDPAKYFKTPLLNKYARAKNMSQDEWIEKEYLPKLARWIAKLNFKYGLYIEGHTQNILARISEETGEILDFTFRDVGDVLTDPLKRTLEGKKYQEGTAEERHRFQVNRHYDDEKKKMREAGENSWGMTAQSLWSFEIKKESQPKWVGIYLKEYLKAVREMPGLENVNVQLPKKLGEGWGPQFAKIVQEIHDKVTKARIPHIEREWYLANREAAREVFLKMFREGHVVYPFRDGYDKISNLIHEDKMKGLVFVSDGKRAYAVESKTSRILGMTGNLSEDTQKRLALPEFKGPCEPATAYLGATQP